MAYTKYSLTPADNNAAPPNGAPEGMLPSAVNDTMRDMMAQIRDVGDGIRGGTYTMTAPVITGGSINGTTVGATTASTGRFSTLTNAALTSGRVTYAGTSGVLQDDADFTFNGTTVTMANDASISGLTVGKGGGAIFGNTAVGASALPASNTGTGFNTAVGYLAMSNNTSGQENTAVGVFSLPSNTTGSYNVAIGRTAVSSNTTGSNNVGVGYQSLNSNTTASNNTAVGYQAGYTNATGASSVYVGQQAGYFATGSGNTFVGTAAGYSVTTGTRNTFVGSAIQGVATGAGYAITTGAANTIIGNFDGNAYGLDIRTASNYAVISDGLGYPLISTSQGRSVALEGAIPQTGEGITFPATQVASSDANTLDDYEEGTWTPTLVSTGGGAPAYTLQRGRYYKIGGAVYVFGEIVINGTLPAGNYTRIQGLPFGQSAAQSGVALKYAGATTVPSGQFITAAVGGSEISFARNDGNGEIGAVGLNASYISTTFSAIFSTVYQVS